MLTSLDLTGTLLVAAGAGLATATLLWVLRRHAPVRRIRLWLMLTIVATGVYLGLSAAGWAADSAGLRVVAAIALLLGANTLLQLFNFLLWDYVLGQRQGIRVPRFAADLLNFFVLAAVTLAILSLVFKTDLTTLLVTSTVISAVIGLALQDLLGNVIAGLALQLERPFAVGDWVQTHGYDGQVVQMDWRTLTLRTGDNAEVTVPNSSAARQELINFSRPTPLQAQHARVSVACEHAPGAVKRVLAAAVTGTPGVLAEPPVDVRVKAYADSGIEYDIIYWVVDLGMRASIQDRVLTRLWYALQRAHMTMPFPQREVTLHSVPADHDATARAEQHCQLVSVLNRLALFSPLGPSQIEQVARSASLQRFTAGEVLVRQGDPGDSLYVICSGHMRVDHRQEDGTTVTLHGLGPDQFFGEMSLFTGAPRTASVIAETDCDVVVVDRASFRDVLLNDPRVLDELTEQLTERTHRVESLVPAAVDAGAELHRRARLGEQIRSFFGL